MNPASVDDSHYGFTLDGRAETLAACYAFLLRKRSKMLDTNPNDRETANPEQSGSGAGLAEVAGAGDAPELLYSNMSPELEKPIEHTKPNQPGSN